MAASTPTYPNSSSDQTDLVIEVRDRRRQNFFTIDNVLLDYYGTEMKPYGIATYVALARFANQDSECWPSLNTLAKRTGMSRQQVIREIDKLKSLKLIEVAQQLGPKGEHRSNLYTLLDIQGVVTHSNQGSNTQLLPLVTHSDQGSNTQLPKQNIDNKTNKNNTNRTTSNGSLETRRNNNNSSGEQNPKQDVVVVLTQRGISENVAQRLADRHKQERIEEKIEFLEFTIETEPDKAKNPAGWLRRAIEENWAAPEGFISKSQRERQAAEKRRQAQEAETQELAWQEDSRRRQKEEEQAQAAYLQLLNEKYGTTDQDIQLWNELVQSLKFQGSSLHALSEQIQPLKFGEETVLLGAPSERIQAQFAHPGTHKIIEREIERVAGRSLKMEVTVVQRSTA